MITTTYYLPFNDETIDRIEKITNKIICFVEKKIIEMNFLKVTFLCRLEDLEVIENDLNDLM